MTTPNPLDTPDYVLEARFKTLLQKARCFEWLESRIQLAEFTEFIYDKEQDEQTFFEFCKYFMNKDPDFQHLKD